MSRTEFSGKVCARAFERAGGRCENCTAKLYPGKINYDHRIPDAMGGKPTLDNCDVLCLACHSIKTRTKDVPAIAKVRRIKARHFGAKKPSTFRKPPGVRWDWKLGRNVREAT